MERPSGLGQDLQIRWRPWLLIRAGFAPKSSHMADQRSPNWANQTANLFWAQRLDTQQQIAEQKSKEEISIATVPARARYLLSVVILTKDNCLSNITRFSDFRKRHQKALIVK